MTDFVMTDLIVLAALGGTAIITAGLVWLLFRTRHETEVPKLVLPDPEPQSSTSEELTVFAIPTDPVDLNHPQEPTKGTDGLPIADHETSS